MRGTENRRRPRFAEASLATLMLLVALGGCGQEAMPTEEPIRPVRTQPMFVTGGERVRSFTGVAQAGVESRLSFRVGGTVRRVAVKVGDRVDAGDLIAELDPTDYRLRMEEAQADLRRRQAEERNARTSYERTERLYENNNASLSDLEAARAGQETAQAALRSAESALEQAETQLGYTTLRAPVEGRIAEVEVERSENVGTGQTVALLAAGLRPEVRVSIPEILIAQIQQGAAVDVEFDALPDRRFAAVVTEVGVMSGDGGTTYPVTVRLEDTDPGIRPGMAAEAAFRFQTAGGRERILAPPGAIGEDHHGRFAFVVREVQDGQGVARRVEVRVGELSGEGLEILEGIEDGDLLVTAGVHKLQDGTRVKLLENPGR